MRQQIIRLILSLYAAGVRTRAARLGHAVTIPGAGVTGKGNKFRKGLRPGCCGSVPLPREAFRWLAAAGNLDFQYPCLELDHRALRQEPACTVDFLAHFLRRRKLGLNDCRMVLDHHCYPGAGRHCRQNCHQLAPPMTRWLLLPEDFGNLLRLTSRRMRRCESAEPTPPSSATSYGLNLPRGFK